MLRALQGCAERDAFCVRLRSDFLAFVAISIRFVGG